MPQLQQPYYNLHQLITGQYTSGNEFVLDDGTDYVGLYYITPNGQRFTGARPETQSKILLQKRITQTPDSLLYNNITLTNTPTYISPTLVTPLPALDDYKNGSIQRYFLQKRNSPQNTIIEVDSPQYNSVNTSNKPGINGVIWNRILVNWIISKIPMNDAKYINELEIQKLTVKFPYLDQHITNFLEYYK